MTQEEIELLDIFAAKAMQAILTNNKCLQVCDQLSDYAKIELTEAIAQMSYEQAEDMLKVRKRFIKENK